MPISTLSNHLNHPLTHNHDQQLRIQNQKLNEQIQQLYQHLNQLLLINQQLNNCLQQKIQTIKCQNRTDHFIYQNINQQEIQTLAYQVVELQNLLEEERNKNNQLISKQSNQQNLQQTISVITQLANSFQSMQTQYQTQITQLQSELQSKKLQFKSLFQNTEEKYIAVIQKYNQLLGQIEKKDEKIACLLSEKELQQSSRSGVGNRKQEISAVTVNMQEIKQKYEQEIEDRDRVIEVYRRLVERLRMKIIEQER